MTLGYNFQFHGKEKIGNVDFANGELTRFESLGGVTIVRSKANDSSFIGQLQSHGYWQGSSYEQFRTDGRNGQWDDFQEGMDGLGVVDPTGIVDLLNGGIYAARG